MGSIHETLWFISSLFNKTLFLILAIVGVELISGI